jgi:cytochrome c oxidase cbb3-type subunit 4
VDIGLFRGLITATLLMLFIGLVAWAWSRKRKAEFEAAAHLPLEDHARPPEKEMRELEQ